MFGCIISQGDEKGRCGYGEHGACGYGIFVGLTAFLIAATFLVFDGIFDNISNIMRRKYIVIADIMTACKGRSMLEAQPYSVVVEFLQ